MKEVWKDIPGYEGKFKISNLGKIEAIERNIVCNKHGGIRKLKKRILKPFLMKNNYYAVDLCYNGIIKRYYLHRLLAKCFISNIENKPQINHIDGNKQNNQIDNLEWATSLENMKHAYNIGLLQKGEECSWHKLTEKEVRSIKKEYIPYENGYKKLAKKYNVHVQTIVSLLNNKSWQHVS